MRMELSLFLERLESQLKELEHQVEWGMVGSQLAHGACVNCKQPVVVQPSNKSYTIITKLLDAPCPGILPSQQ